MSTLLLNTHMFDHDFHAVTYWRIGPVRNQLGYTFAVAEIGTTWLLRWQDPRGQQHIRYYVNHDHVVDAIELLNQGRALGQ